MNQRSFKYISEDVLNLPLDKGCLVNVEVGNICQWYNHKWYTMSMESNKLIELLSWKRAFV